MRRNSLSSDGGSGDFVAASVIFRGGFGLLVWLNEALGHGSGHHGLRRRSWGSVGEPFEVLNGGGQEKLIAGAGEAPQSEPDHRENGLGLAKEGFDSLALGSRDPVGLGLHQATRVVAGGLVDVP